MATFAFPNRVDALARVSVGLGPDPVPVREWCVASSSTGLD